MADSLEDDEIAFDLGGHPVRNHARHVVLSLAYQNEVRLKPDATYDGPAKAGHYVLPRTAEDFSLPFLWPLRLA